MYLVFTSRLREQPLHIMSLGSSASGKTYLQEKVSELIPEEEKIEITTLSENALYYLAIIHNPPTGDTEPSSSDYLLTLQLRNVGKMIGIPIVDHLIVSSERYFSFNDNELL